MFFFESKRLFYSKSFIMHRLLVSDKLFEFGFLCEGNHGAEGGIILTEKDSALMSRGEIFFHSINVFID